MRAVLIAILLGVAAQMGGCSWEVPKADDTEVRQALVAVLDACQYRDAVAAGFASTFADASGSLGRDAAAVNAALASLEERNDNVGALRDPQTFESFRKSESRLSDALAALVHEVANHKHTASDPHVERITTLVVIANARIDNTFSRYNDAANRYNASLRHFPGGIALQMDGYTRYPLFDETDFPPAMRRRGRLVVLPGPLRV